ncbi:MAG: glycosyltransferase family 39 protein [Anaerolineae bacterium]|nr:glycosyltransferase family 39 protein [Anaerolineae bacterium]
MAKIVKDRHLRAFVAADARTKLLVLFMLALVVRFAAAAGYLNDPSPLGGGDYGLYSIGGEHIRDYGDFSNSLFLARPPLYPLMICVLGLNTGAVLLVNCALGALLAPLSYILARQMALDEPFALLAGAILIFDPAEVAYSANLYTEPLANTLLLSAIMLLLFSVRRAKWVGAAGAGALLALSALARPAAYLLWVLLGIILLVAYRRRWRIVMVFAGVCAAGVLGWTVHNGIVFGHYTFNTVGPYTMLYYRAVSVERFATGQEVDAIYEDFARRVEARLGHDTANVDAGARHGHLAATPEVQQALTAVALEVFAAHPLAYLATIPQGLVRMFAHTPVLAAWLIPFDVAWNGLFVTGTVLGLWFAYRRKQWLLFGLVFWLGAYYVAGTLAVSVSAIDTRKRTMLTPLMAVTFAYAVQEIVTRQKKRGGAIGRTPAQGEASSQDLG